MSHCHQLQQQLHQQEHQVQGVRTSQPPQNHNRTTAAVQKGPYVTTHCNVHLATIPLPQLIIEKATMDNTTIDKATIDESQISNHK